MRYRYVLSEQGKPVFQAESDDLVFLVHLDRVIVDEIEDEVIYDGSPQYYDNGYLVSIEDIQR